MKKEKTGKQVEIFYFCREEGTTRFLLLKRVPEKGGFWQPLTGGNEVGESIDETIWREGEEETGIKREQVLCLVDTGFSFEFTDSGRDWQEFVYGAEVDAGTPITLSAEHEDQCWATFEEALDLLKWPDNKTGLKRLEAEIRTTT